MDISSLVIQLVSGAVGGNVAGHFLKRFDLGLLYNSIAGILGGGIGGQLLGIIGFGVSEGSWSLWGIVSQIVAGGVGGSVLLILFAVIRSILNK